MATTETTRTVYGAARGQKLLAGGFEFVEQAQHQVDLYTEQLTALDIDPDVRLVEYDVVTTVKEGRLRAYKEPVDEPVETEQVADAAGDAV
jgi:hypothetical protein